MNIVITGSSQGIGFQLAKEFLNHGDKVVISSSNEDRINKAIEDLKSEFPEENVNGIVCNVTNPDNIRTLVDFSLDKLGFIDIWINNAGTTGFEYDKHINISDKAIETAVKTNMLGTLFGSREALKVLLKQGKGKIINLGGYGTNGMASPNLASYGATKSSIPQLTKTLIKETKNKKIGVHILLPGMVLTDLLLKNADARAKKFFNITAEKPETIAKKLVPKIREIKGTGKKIKFNSSLKFFWIMMTAWRRKNRFFDDEGNPVD